MQQLSALDDVLDQPFMPNAAKALLEAGFRLACERRCRRFGSHADGG